MRAARPGARWANGHHARRARSPAISRRARPRLRLTPARSPQTVHPAPPCPRQPHTRRTATRRSLAS
jgi:hypothetical protein